MKFSVHDMIEEAVKAAEQDAYREINALDEQLFDESDFEKTAAATQEDSQEFSADATYFEKMAEAVEFILSELSEAETPVADLQARLQKVAMKPTKKGTGGGEQMTTLAAKNTGTQSQNFGKANKQWKNSPLQAIEGGAAKASIQDNAQMPANCMAEVPSGVGHSKKAEREELKARIMAKLGGVSNGDEANITQAPLQGPEGVWAAGEGPKASGKGANLVDSNEKAINLTKRQGKDLVRSDLAALLTEPALSKKTDPVLHENLRNASSAGVKIAGASTKDVIRNRLMGEV